MNALATNRIAPAMVAGAFTNRATIQDITEAVAGSRMGKCSISVNESQ
jgi:NADH:ubiquinone oxidoreductase subunit D